MDGYLELPEQEAVTQRKQMKKDVSKLSMEILFYNLLMWACVFMNCIVGVVAVAIRYKGELPDAALDEQFTAMMQSGLAYIVSVLIGTILLGWFYRKSKGSNLFINARKMTGKSFVSILCVLMSFQLVNTAVVTGLEGILNSLGYTLMDDVDSASDLSMTLSMFLYASIIGPITEELVFRGFVLRSLQKYGKVLAIIVSSLLFGLFHDNLAQLILAIGVGLILGYVTCEYSIKWAILLHIINNCIFNDFLLYLMRALPEDIQEIIFTSINIIFFILGTIICLKKKKSIKDYYNKEKYMPLRYALSSVGFIVFSAIAIFVASTGIEKLGI